MCFQSLTTKNNYLVSSHTFEQHQQLPLLWLSVEVNWLLHDWCRWSVAEMSIGVCECCVILCEQQCLWVLDVITVSTPFTTTLSSVSTKRFSKCHWQITVCFVTFKSAWQMRCNHCWRHVTRLQGNETLMYTRRCCRSCQEHSTYLCSIAATQITSCYLQYHRIPQSVNRKTSAGNDPIWFHYAVGHTWTSRQSRNIQ